MSAAATSVRSLPRKAATGLIRGYQVLISPLLGSSCRFTPTCSAYAITSVERFGVIQGGWLAAKRIGRCHPWNPGGYDPVPESPRGPNGPTRPSTRGHSAGGPS